MPRGIVYPWEVEETQLLIDLREESYIPLSYNDISIQMNSTRTPAACASHYLRTCALPLTRSVVINLRNLWMSHREAMFGSEAHVCGGITFVEYERVAHCAMTETPQSFQDRLNINCQIVTGSYLVHRRSMWRKLTTQMETVSWMQAETAWKRKFQLPLDIEEEY